MPQLRGQLRRFPKHAPGRAGRGARDLEDVTDGELERLSTGTGVFIERLREMNAAAMMRRVNERVQGWLLSENGREALEELRATLSRMAGRSGAYATADTGRIARRNRDVYGE